LGKQVQQQEMGEEEGVKPRKPPTSLASSQVGQKSKRPWGKKQAKTKKKIKKEQGGEQYFHP